jgi:predicted O-methyltransferase YrrM
MSSQIDIYINADELENLPILNRDNYLFETKILQQELSQNAQVLQIGSMDGMRILRLLKVRPDLHLTSLELEEELVKVAKQNMSAAGISAKFVTADITDPPALPKFDYVICLKRLV